MTKSESYKIPEGYDYGKWKESYNYQPELTGILDALSGDFTQSTVNQIVLWKVNRYAPLESVLMQINQIPTDENYEPNKNEVTELVGKMMECQGVRLAMASTILRFRNPHVFQIIDQRVYRIIYNDKMPKKQSPDMYWDYLIKLREYCETRDLPFKDSDRILYAADKDSNKGKKLDY